MSNSNYSNRTLLGDAIMSGNSSSMTLDEDKFLLAFMQVQDAKLLREANIQQQHRQKVSRSITTADETIETSNRKRQRLTNQPSTSISSMPATATSSSDKVTAATITPFKNNKFSFLLGGDGNGGGFGCKPCNPYDGLTLGGRPLSKEQLLSLGPDALVEDVLERNGVPLSIEELGDLLGLDDVMPMFQDIE